MDPGEQYVQGQYAQLKLTFTWGSDFIHAGSHWGGDGSKGTSYMFSLGGSHTKSAHICNANARGREFRALHRKVECSLPMDSTPALLGVSSLRRKGSSSHCVNVYLFVLVS